MGSMGGAMHDGVEEATKNGLPLGSFEAFAIFAGIGGHVLRTCSRKWDVPEEGRRRGNYGASTCTDEESAEAVDDDEGTHNHRRMRGRRQGDCIGRGDNNR